MMTRKAVSVILGVLMIIAGVYCFFTPVETSTVIPFVLGIVMVGDGIGRIVTWLGVSLPGSISAILCGRALGYS